MKTIRQMFNHNSSGAVKISFAAFLAMLLAVSGLAFAGKLDTSRQASLELRIDPTPIKRADGFRTSFAPVVKEVAPAVVKVNVSAKARQVGAPQGWPFSDDPLFRRFFGPGRQFRSPKPMPQPHRQGFGSGVIVTQDGYLLTNNHVVEEADTIEVELADNRKFTATLVGTDPKTDIAVLRIDAKDLPYVTLGDSDRLEIGDVVLAVGNPFGIGQTVTQGIISGVGRAHMGLEYEDFIQTDAAINPGNSGGALVDADGRLIGINTAIISRGGGNDGVGFAVPVNLARHVLESIVTDGRVVRGHLGVRIQNVTAEMAKYFELDDAKGALIAEVEKDSPADRAGLEPGDVVVKFNGRQIKDSRHLKLAVGQSTPDRKANLTVLRDGRKMEMTAQLGQLNEPSLASNDSGAFTEDKGALKGLQVADPDQDVRREHDIPESVRGAVVVGVKPESAVAAAGLRPGDVILEINRHHITNADDAVAMTEKREHDTMLLRVWREGATRYVIVNEKPVS